MPAVRDLDGLGRAAPDAVGVSAGAVARDDLDAGMALQPRPDGLRVAVGQQVDRAVALQVDDERAVASPAAPSPVIDAHHARCRGHRHRSGLDQAQQRVAADRHGKPRRQPGAGLAPGAERDAALGLGEAGGAPRLRRRHRGQALGEDTARAPGSGAPEAPDLEFEPADTALPRQVAEAAGIPAVDAARPAPANGA